MNKLNLKAEKRKLTGRKIKSLRSRGILPANVYGKKVESLAVEVKTDEFLKVFNEVGETGLVELVVGGSKRPVLIHNLQLDPVKDTPLHVDFLQVDLKQKVSARVPVELTNESPAEKQGLGTVVQYINEIEVEALPADLPEKFEIDASLLTQVEQSVLVKDLSVDSKKVEVKEDLEKIAVKVEPPVKEEEVAPPTGEEEAAGVEKVEEEGKVEEEEALEEGGKKAAEGKEES